MKHQNAWKWDSTHHIPPSWWDRGVEGIRNSDGSVRKTDEIYACDCGCGGWMLSATKFDVDHYNKTGKIRWL